MLVQVKCGHEQGNVDAERAKQGKKEKRREQRSHQVSAAKSVCRTLTMRESSSTRGI